MELFLFSAFTIGALHAVAPDHWVPFVALAKAQQWSRKKTSWLVFLSGIGHLGSSIVITILGIAAGFGLPHVNDWEAHRGNFASLLLIGFGIAYMIWGMKQWSRKNINIEQTRSVTYWMLFIVVIFGPCEPLIPVIFSAFSFGAHAVLFSIGVFSFATLAMMQLQVHAALWGVSFLNPKWMVRSADFTAGVVIVTTGIVIRIFGL
ncbi:MAG: hypothetical protein H3C35_02365 [Bacteroidetes bacterium]|nr:hypothetical protein [Bacteroidota bacterium]